MVINKQIIDQALANMGQRNTSFKTAQPFQNFAPLGLTEEYGVDPTANTAQYGLVRQGSLGASAIQGTRLENKANYDWMKSQEDKVEGLRNQLSEVQGESTGTGNQGAQTGSQRPSQPGGPENEAGKWGTTPEVSDIKKLRPNAPMETLNYHGMQYQVNKQVAPIFQAFLQELWQKGYRPSSIGGYADRNIAGTNTPSLHSYGYAIDIDPSKNPVQYGVNRQTMQESMPPGINALAAKYGLAWGGAWSGDKKDPMHFSIPYGGTK